MHEQIRKYESGLPVGFHTDTGDLVTLEQAEAHPASVQPAATLTPEQRRRLALERIETAGGWPEREFYPGGHVDKTRAIAEISSGGEIGDALVDIEVRVASWVVEQLRKEQADG